MTTVHNDATEPSFRRFVVVWCGQFASMAGSSLSGFALGVYAYLQTGSVTTLGFIYALSYLAMILALPAAGSLADRWGPWRSLVVSNVAALVVMLALAASFASGRFQIWHIYPVVAALSVVNALFTPAFEAAMPLMVPRHQLGRANGMRMIALATSQVLAPVTAGYALLVLDISGLILLDCLSFALALLTLALVRIARPPASPESASRPSSLLGEFADAWRWVTARRGLLALMVFLGALNFCAGFVDLLITPLVLAFASTESLGTVMSVGGAGMVVASVGLSIWGGPRHRLRGLLWSSLALGVATVLGALRPSIPLIAAAAVLFLGSLAVVMGTNQAIWQSKAEPAMLGRIMALLNIVANAPQLVAYALAGLAADRVFTPLVGREEVRSPVLAAVVGDGPGRGNALLLMVVGVLIVGCVVAGFAHPRLRDLDREVPDADAREDTEEDSTMPVQPVRTTR